MQKLILAMLFLVAADRAVAQEHAHAHETLGTVEFPVGCNQAAQKKMNTAVAMLHSFWLAEARRTFEAAAAADPACGVAYWGVALTHFGNPFAGGPNESGNKAGWEAAERAAAIGGRTERDRAYIAAAGALYKNYSTVPNRTRMRAYEAALTSMSGRMQDTETEVFRALWMIANASPGDLTFSQQKKAAEILNPLFLKNPRHPGLAHYIIHAFDSPPLAGHALEAARRYAEIAPAAPHALHMPSHTFTRLGYWDESIRTNRKSADLEPTRGAKAHAADYMVYAYLQQGRDDAARAVLDEVGISTTGDGTLAAGSSLAGYNAVAMPARFALERNDWVAAAALAPVAGPPAAESVTRFARALGAARSGNPAQARAELHELNQLVAKASAQGDTYWPVVIDAQRMAAEAWVAHLEDDHARALQLAAMAADKEETVEKSPVTPGPLIPARELLGDILMVHAKPADALAAYEKTLAHEPNRLRTIIGAARAAKAMGKLDVATKYYGQALTLLAADSKRPELAEAKLAAGK